MPLRESTYNYRACIRTLLISIAAAAMLALAGCGGSTSTSSGGAGFSSGGSTVSGNVSSSGNGVALRAGDNDMLVTLLSALATPAHADIEGIEVCLLDICTTTDASGNFTLPIAGLESGNYTLTFRVGGVIYSYPLSQEISGSDAVVLTDVSISESGNVSVGNVSYIMADEESLEEVEEVEGSVSGNISSAPDNAEREGQDKIVICHKPGTPAENTLIVAEPAANAHLGHGDYLGACSSGDDSSDDDDGEQDPS